MTPTEKARRSDALYYETVSVNRRVLCDMIANRESDLEDARAESEHMRLKALAVMGELQEENERLKAENDKLRELIYDLIVDEERGHNDDVTFREHVIKAHECGIAQGIEADA